MQTQKLQETTTTKKNGGGLGFIVEKLLNDLNDESTSETECEWNAGEKKYDEIKKSILVIYSKIRQRRNYSHSAYKAENKTDVYINYSKVREQYRELLKLLYAETKNNETKHRAKWHIVMLYRLLAFTRDISDGCGERELAYMQLFELARMDAGAACEALKIIVTLKKPMVTSNDKTTTPIGSWKDIKGLVAYMRRSMNMRDDQDMAAYLELTKFAVNLVNARIAKDVLAFYKDDDEIVGNDKDDNEEVSFVSKWIPRENKSKKYGNFYERLACDYYKDWLPKDRNANPVSYEKAVVKCKIHYRKLVSTLNQYLETPQIKMCQQRWSDIAFSKTTRLTRDLQDRAFLNLSSDDHRIKRHADDTDRVTCAEKYKVWKCDTINRINGIKTDLETHVRVVKYYSACGSLAFNRNAEWAAFASQEALKNKLSRVIPVLAGSSHKAIGLALASAENATTGKTIIVKDCNAVNLYHLDASFVQNVKHLSNTVQLRCSPMFSVYCHPLYKCLISGLKLLIESNVAANQTRNVEDPEFTMMIFTDDDSCIFFNNDDDDGVSFEEVRNEASLLYREFGYGVPNVVVWAMTPTVCMNNDNNNDENNDDMKKEMVSYKSVSYGGALTLRVGCDKNDICKYLGLENINQEETGNKYRYYNNNHNNQCNEWQSEWNHLVETLYNPRYYYFEKHFWKK